MRRIKLLKPFRSQRCGLSWHTVFLQQYCITFGGAAGYREYFLTLAFEGALVGGAKREKGAVMIGHGAVVTLGGLPS